MRYPTTSSTCIQTGEELPIDTRNLLHYISIIEVKSFVLGQLELLRQQNVLTQSYRFARSSAKNIVSGIRTWHYFCHFYDCPPLPARTQDLINFLELNSFSSGYAHLKHLLHCVDYYHQINNTSVPTRNFALDSTLQGLKRKLAGTPNQVLPIKPDLLRKMYQKLDMSKDADLALWCGYLTTFRCLFRKSNSVPESQKYDERKILTRRHIQLNHETRTVLVYVSWSKTIQFGGRDIIIPIPPNDDPALDLYSHINMLFTRVKVNDRSPAFSYGPNKFVTYTTFTSNLKSLLKRCGVEPSDYSGHSFRRGGATYLHSLGGTGLQIQASGDWSTQTFLRYLHLTLEDRWASQVLMSEGISSTVGQV